MSILGIREMSEAKSYEDQQGNTVFTAAYHKARGYCCKSACLHCPYGFTLKKLGVQFQDYDDSRKAEALAILQEANEANFDLAAFTGENIKFIEVKQHVAGLLVKNHIVVKRIFLREHFRSQGLDKDIVESYYFS